MYKFVGCGHRFDHDHLSNHLHEQNNSFSPVDYIIHSTNPASQTVPIPIAKNRLVPALD